MYMPNPCHYPAWFDVTSLLGVPRSEIRLVSELLATKLIENEFVAYQNSQELMASPDALSKRGFTIVTYALCGFANLSSVDFHRVMRRHAPAS